MPSTGPSHRRFFAALVLLASTLALLPQRTRLELAYERAALGRAELWRLLSANVVHAGWLHLLWNVAGLALVWVAFGPRLGAAAWTAAAVASGLAASVGVHLWHPEVRAMLGLSGLLHGLLAAGSLAELRAGGGLGGIALAVLVAKLIWEQIAGPLGFSRAALGGTIAVEAHLYGALAGALAGLTLPLREESRVRS